MVEIKSTMAGCIWKVVIKQGEEIVEGQDLVILESMKMEIPITSDIAGKVHELKVSEGDFVNEGDVIAMIE